MQIRIPCVAALLVSLLGGALCAQAAPSDDRRLLVLESPANVLTKTARERLHAAIAEVALSQGLTIASPKGLPDKLLGCDLPGCLPSIAAASGAIFVLRVDAKYAKESFKLGLELWNSDEGKLLGKERRDCPICDEQDLWGSAALMARGLLERALRVPTTAVEASPASAPAAQPIAAAQLTQASPSPGRPIARYSGLGLAVLGAAALATGIYYWSVDGNHVDPDHVRDTRKLGLPMTVAGGAALLAGAGLIGWSFWPGTTVSVAPSGLHVAGRF